MADLKTLTAELNDGVFSDNLLRTKLDTQERLDGLFQDFNIDPVKYSPMIPKDLQTNDILNYSPTRAVGAATPLPNRLDLLTSGDPKKAQLAMDDMERELANNKAFQKGIGLPSRIAYTPGQERYTEDGIFKESNTMKYGYNPFMSLAENENFYHENVWDNYSLGGQLWRGVGTFAGRVLSKLGTGLVGMVGDVSSMAWNGLQEMVDAKGNNFWADVSENYLARQMEHLDAKIKEDILPVYKSLDYDNKGAFAKLGDSQFWQGTAADGVGFLLQFAIPSTLLGKAAVAGKAGRLGKFGKVMGAGVGELEGASALQKGIGSALEFATGSRNVGGISAHIFSTTMEAAAETKEGFNSTVEGLVRGGMSEEEAKQIAGENAVGHFGKNMAILSASNALENKWFQQAAGNRKGYIFGTQTRQVDEAGKALQNTYKTKLGKFFNDNAWGNRIGHYGGGAAKSIGMEAIWEENAQLAAARSAKGGYMRKGFDNSETYEESVGFWKQMAEQTFNASVLGKGDKEAADAIMAGAVIGVLGNTGFSKISGGDKAFEGERRKGIKDQAAYVARMNNARDAWLTINDRQDELYEKEADGKTFKMVDGKPVLDQKKLEERIEEINLKLSAAGNEMAKVATLENMADGPKKQDLEYLTFGNYVKAHIQNESIDTLVARLENWQTKSPEELALYGVNETVARDPMKWAALARELNDRYKEVSGVKYRNTENDKPADYSEKVKAVRNRVFDYTFTEYASRETANSLRDLAGDMDPFESDANASVNRDNAEKISLEFALSNSTTDAQKAKYKGLIAEVEKRIKEQKALLTDFEEDKQGFIYDKNKDNTDLVEKMNENLQFYVDYSTEAKLYGDKAEHMASLIKDYSDPDKALAKYDQEVEYWAGRLEREKTEMEIKREADAKAAADAARIAQEAADLAAKNALAVANQTASLPAATNTATNTPAATNVTPATNTVVDPNANTAITSTGIEPQDSTVMDTSMLPTDVPSSVADEFSQGYVDRDEIDYSDFGDIDNLDQDNWEAKLEEMEEVEVAVTEAKEIVATGTPTVETVVDEPAPMLTPADEVAVENTIEMAGEITPEFGEEVIAAMKTTSKEDALKAILAKKCTP